MRGMFVLFAALAGCASPTTGDGGIDALVEGEAVQGVRLSIESSSYRHAQAAVLHLINSSSGQIGYNSCTAARDRWTSAEWVRIEPLRMCAAALFPLPAGGQIRFEEPVTSEWVPGRYRVVLRIYLSDRNENFLVASPQFEVTG